MLNMFRMLIHPSSGACDLFVELFHGLYCSGSMCVSVTLWFVSLILIVQYFGVSRFSLHVLLYHMVVVVLCSRLLMFLYSCIILPVW